MVSADDVVEIVLSKDEIQYCRMIGEARDNAARAQGKKHAYGLKADEKEGKRLHVIGACGEAVVAKYLGISIYRALLINSWKAADLAEDIQVRTTQGPKPMPIRKTDNPGDRYVHVIAHLNQPRVFHIVGWCYAAAVVRKVAPMDPGNRNSPAWFIGPDLLEPMGKMERVKS